MGGRGPSLAVECRAGVDSRCDPGREGCGGGRERQCDGCDEEYGYGRYGRPRRRADLLGDGPPREAAGDDAKWDADGQGADREPPGLPNDRRGELTPDETARLRNREVLPCSCDAGDEGV